MPRNAAASLLMSAFGGSSAEEAMRAVVVELLTTAVSEPPAPLELLGSLRGVVRIEARPIARAGRLVPIAGGGYVVQVNETESPGRQRFSTAHEICHTFFNEVRRSPRTHDDLTTGLLDAAASEEFLCDLGAAHMLLHPEWLQRLASNDEPSLDRLFEIAATCGASAEATVTCPRVSYHLMS